MDLAVLIWLWIVKGEVVEVIEVIVGLWIWVVVEIEVALAPAAAVEAVVLASVAAVAV